MKDYKKLAGNFNEARMNLQNEVLSGKEMYHLLTRTVGFGKDSELLSLLSKKGIIRHIGHNQYMFTSTPVYYGKIKYVIQLHNHTKYTKYGKISLSKAIQVCQENGYSVVCYGNA